MESNVVGRSNSLIDFLDKNPLVLVKGRKKKCASTLSDIESFLDYADTKHDLLVGMSDTLKFILDYFTSLQDKCNHVKMKTRCMKVMVSQYR